MKKNNTRLIREMNNSLVLNVIRRGKALSRAEVSRILDIDRATVTKVSSELLENNLIRTSGSAPSTKKGGRKGELLELNPDGKYAVCIHWDYTCLNGVVLGLDGSLRKKMSTEISPEASNKEVAAAIGDILSTFNIPPRKLAGVCIAVRGIVNPKTGDMNMVLPFHPMKRNLKPELESLGSSGGFSIENDLNMAAFAGMASDDKSGDLNIIYSSTGGGACGIIIEGKLYRGGNFSSGEWKEIDAKIIYSRQKYFNNRNFSPSLHIESLLNKITEITGEKTDLQDIAAKIKAGNETCMEILSEFIEVYSAWLSNIINFVDPDKVIIESPLNCLGDIFIDIIRRKLKKYVFLFENRNLKILSPGYGEGQRAIGGACFILEKYFNSAGTP